MAFYFYTADKGAALAHGDGGRGLVGLRGLGAFPLGHPAASGGFRSVFPRRPCMSAASRWRPPFGVLPPSIFVIAPAERRSSMNLSHGARSSL